VVTFAYGGNSRETSRLEDFTVHRFPEMTGFLLFSCIRKYKQIFQSYLRELSPDVVHAHDFYGMMLSGWRGPSAFTIHGFIHEDTRLSSTRFSWMRSKLWKYFETASWAEQPNIISISPYVRERLRGIAKGTIHDICNAIHSECFEVHRCPERGVVFSTALICRRKNTLQLVRAIHKLRNDGTDARLVLAGPVSEPLYGAKVEAYIAEHSLREHINMLGSVSRKEIQAQLARANVFALVSFEEGAPMGVSEALAAGVPVVASNLCGMPYMVTNNETGFLVNPNRPEEIAYRLARLIENESLANSMGERGKSFAREREKTIILRS